MCTRSVKTAFPCVVLALLLASLAAGQPQYQPPWWNQTQEDNDGRTFRESYGFGTNADPPEGTPGITPPWYHHFGTLVETTGSGHWIAELAGHQGAWGVQGNGQRATITFHVWNMEAGDSEKHVWVQFDVYVQNGAVGGPSCRCGPPDRPAGGFNIPHPWEDLGNGWRRCWREWKIKPQPLYETITFTLATAASGGTAAIDNVYIGTNCAQEDKDGDDSAFDFQLPDWPFSVPLFFNAPGDHDPPMFQPYGPFLPQWMESVTDHDGVVGLPGGFPAQGGMSLWQDGTAAPEGTVSIACQYDYFSALGGIIECMPVLPPGTVIENFEDVSIEFGDGWLRRLIRFDASPPPDWKSFEWYMETVPFGGPVVVDNIAVSSGTSWQDHWYAGFDGYEEGQNLHGVDGWKGWDNDPTLTAFVTEAVSNTPAASVEIAAGSDFVQEFDGRTSDKWRFTAWQYIPGDFTSGGSDPFAGSYFILMNTYADGGPHEADHWSVQMQFDSNDGMLKVYHGDGLNTINVPYDTDRWVKIDVLVDLDDDWTRIYYDDNLVTEYPWTGGVLGGGDGAFDVAAVDLFANGSSPVYYDDLHLMPIKWPAGDMDCDGDVDFDDIDPFVKALEGQAAYEAAYPDCEWINGDIDGDGDVDFDDIDPFVEVLAG